MDPPEKVGFSKKKKEKKKIDVWREEYKSNESASAEVCN